MKEAKFVLLLIKKGYEPEEIDSIMKHFWSGERVDMRSAAMQAAILSIPEVKKSLLERAAELDAKKNGTFAPDPSEVEADMEA